MIGKTIHSDWKHGIRKPFDHVTSFKSVLAVAIGCKPPRSGVVYEGVVESLGDLMADCGHVLKSAPEQAGTDPAGVVKNKTPLAKPIVGSACLKIVCVETQDAAVVGVTTLIQIGVGEQEGGEVTSLDVARKLGLTNHRGIVRQVVGRREEVAKKCAFIDKDKAATSTIR